MSVDNIYIYTQPVQSGKTTTLQQWLRKNNMRTAGILTPDNDGKRMLYDISRNEFHDLEMDDKYPAEESLLVGKYKFGKKGFETARKILLDGLKDHPEWLIVDEVGTLELDDNTGLEPALTEVVNAYKSDSVKGSLILVVRDYLRDEVISRFGLSDSNTLHKSFFE